MFKVTSSRLIKITKTLEKADFAINTLERLGQNKMVFMDTKRDIQELIDELKSQYELEQFTEWKDRTPIKKKPAQKT